MPDPSDPASSALEWRAIEQAADPGPWEATGISYEDIWSDSKGGFIAETFGGPETARFIATARTAMPLLVAAVEAALKLHRPLESVVRNICAAHATGSKWRKSATLAEFRAEVEACPDCRKEDVQVCAHCQCPDDEWPCPTYRAITTALTGDKPAR
jgi:hypothetical protein